MADELDPPRKHYQLKPRDFERVNAPSAQRPPSLPHFLPAPPSPPRIDVQQHYRQAASPGPVLSQGVKPTERNDVHGILDENYSRADAAGLNVLTPKPKRRSRRTRDYFVVVIPLNAFFAFAAFGPLQNAAMMAYGIAGMIIATLGLAWIMFFVMDDY